MRTSLLLCLLLVPISAFAQVTAAGPSVPDAVAGSEKLAWDQAAATLAEAQGMTFRLILDQVGVTTPVPQPEPLPSTCTGVISPYVCSAPFPALTPGTHALQVTASLVDGRVTLTSAVSTPPLVVRMIVQPAAPERLRIQ